MSSPSLIRVSCHLTARSLVRPSAAAVAQSTSTVHENDPETLEREKQKNLAGKQYKTSSPHEHATGWNEYLATLSEAAVKADRSESGPDDLQKSAAEHIRARNHADEDDEAQRGTHAGPDFQKEVVKGPPGSAKGNVGGRDDRSGGVGGGRP